MKLHEHRQAQMNLISRYGNGEIVINAQLLQAPLIVAPGFIHASWVGSLEELTLQSLQPVWPLQPRILLLGSDHPLRPRAHCAHNWHSERWRWKPWIWAQPAAPTTCWPRKTAPSWPCYFPKATIQAAFMQPGGSLPRLGGS